MNGQIFVISDASKLLDVEPHVLRNWEYELKLKIQRNELGHRFYTEDNMRTLKMVKKLKEHGFILKHIKLLLPSFNQLNKLSSDALYSLRDKLCINYSPINDVSVVPFETSKNNYSSTLENSSISESIYTSSNISKKEILHNVLKDILVEILNENYDAIKKDLINSITTNISKEFNYHLMQHESREDEYLESLSYTLYPKKNKPLKKKIALK